jgi:hypothetical protein
MITGQPKLFLRLEGLALFAASLAAFIYLRQSFWIFAALFLVPDLCLALYFLGPRGGAVIYNICHSTIGPWLLAIYGVLAGELFAQVLASIWLAHIGFDRAIGYGLKYPSDFRDTHLGRIGRAAN